MAIERCVWALYIYLQKVNIQDLHYKLLCASHFYILMYPHRASALFNQWFYHCKSTRWGYPHLLIAAANAPRADGSVFSCFCFTQPTG